MKEKLIGRIPEVKFLIFILDALQRTGRGGLVAGLIFERLRRHLDDYRALLRVFQGMIKFSFESGFFCLLTSSSDEISTALMAIALVQEIDWDALFGHDWFLYA